MRALARFWSPCRFSTRGDVSEGRSLRIEAPDRGSVIGFAFSAAGSRKSQLWQNLADDIGSGARAHCEHTAGLPLRLRYSVITTPTRNVNARLI